MRSTSKALQDLHRIIEGTDDILMKRKKYDTSWRVHRTYVRNRRQQVRTVREVPDENDDDNIKNDNSELYDLLQTMNNTMKRNDRPEMNSLRDSLKRETIRAECMREELKDMRRAMSEEKDLSKKLRSSIQIVREENERTRDELISIVETLGSEVLKIREEQQFDAQSMSLFAPKITTTTTTTKSSIRDAISELVQRIGPATLNRMKLSKLVGEIFNMINKTEQSRDEESETQTRLRQELEEERVLREESDRIVKRKHEEEMKMLLQEKQKKEALREETVQSVSRKWKKEIETLESRFQRKERSMEDSDRAYQETRDQMNLLTSRIEELKTMEDVSRQELEEEREKLKLSSTHLNRLESERHEAMRACEAAQGLAEENARRAVEMESEGREKIKFLKKTFQEEASASLLKEQERTKEANERSVESNESNMELLSKIEMLESRLQRRKRSMEDSDRGHQKTRDQVNLLTSRIEELKTMEDVSRQELEEEREKLKLSSTHLNRLESERLEATKACKTAQGLAEENARQAAELESKCREDIEYLKKSFQEETLREKQKTKDVKMKQENLEDTVSYLELELRRKVESQIELMNELNQASTSPRTSDTHTATKLKRLREEHEDHVKSLCDEIETVRSEETEMWKKESNLQNQKYESLQHEIEETKFSLLHTQQESRELNEALRSTLQAALSQSRSYEDETSRVEAQRDEMRDQIDQFRQELISKNENLKTISRHEMGRDEILTQVKEQSSECILRLTEELRDSQEKISTLRSEECETRRKISEMRNTLLESADRRVGAESEIREHREEQERSKREFEKNRAEYEDLVRRGRSEIESLQFRLDTNESSMRKRVQEMQKSVLELQNNVAVLTSKSESTSQALKEEESRVLRWQKRHEEKEKMLLKLGNVLQVERAKSKLNEMFLCRSEEESREQSKKTMSEHMNVVERMLETRREIELKHEMRLKDLNESLREYRNESEIRETQMQDEMKQSIELESKERDSLKTLMGNVSEELKSVRENEIELQKKLLVSKQQTERLESEEISSHNEEHELMSKLKSQKEKEEEYANETRRVRKELLSANEQRDAARDQVSNASKKIRELETELQSAHAKADLAHYKSDLKKKFAQLTHDDGVKAPEDSPPSSNEDDEPTVPSSETTDNISHDENNVEKIGEIKEYDEDFDEDFDEEDEDEDELKIPADELKTYETLFSKLDPENTGTAEGKHVKAILRRSGLPKSQLKTLVLVSRSLRPEVSNNAGCVAVCRLLRLIAFVQNGGDITTKDAIVAFGSKSLPIAKIEGILPMKSKTKKKKKKKKKKEKLSVNTTPTTPRSILNSTVSSPSPLFPSHSVDLSEISPVSSARTPGTPEFPSDERNQTFETPISSFGDVDKSRSFTTTPIGQNTTTTSVELSLDTSAVQFPGGEGGSNETTVLDETDSMMSDMLASFGND